jgi:hypothetical protein
MNNFHKQLRNFDIPTSLNFTSHCPVFFPDSKGRYLFDQVSFLESIQDKLLKLLDRHPNRVTLFVWLGTWQCHTIVLSWTLTSVVLSLPLLYIYLLYIQTFQFHVPEI